MVVVGHKWDDWQKRVTCQSPRCEAILEVTASDILTICDEDTADYYRVKCPLCGHLTRMKEVDIPPYVRIKCFS